MAIVMETMTSNGVEAVEPPVPQPPPVPVPPGEPTPTPQPGNGEEPPEVPVPTLEEPGEPDGDTPQGRGGFQARIKNLVGQRNALRDESMQLRAQLAAYEQAARQATVSQPTQPQQTLPQQASGLIEPRQDDYADPALFAEALRRYWRAMSREEARAEFQDAFQQMQAQQQHQQMQVAKRHWDIRMREGQEHYDDFDTAWRVLPQYVPEDLYPVIEHVVLQEEKGAHLFYYLTTHPHAMETLAHYRPGPQAEAYLRSLLPKNGASNGAPPLPSSPVAANGTHSLPPVRPLTGTGPVPAGGETPAQVAARGGSIAEYTAAKERMQAQGLR